MNFGLQVWRARRQLQMISASVTRQHVAGDEEDFQQWAEEQIDLARQQPPRPRPAAVALH